MALPFTTGLIFLWILVTVLLERVANSAAETVSRKSSVSSEVGDILGLWRLVVVSPLVCVLLLRVY